MEYFVEKLPSHLQGQENEKYAYMRSSEFRNVYAQPMYKLASRGIEGYLSITNRSTGKKIYRKYCGWTEMEESTIGLGYRSLCELGITEEDFISLPKEVIVKKAHWFCYYWKNSDSGIRVPFRIAVWGIFVGVISFVLQILFYIIPNCC